MSSALRFKNVSAYTKRHLFLRPINIDM